VAKAPIRSSWLPARGLISPGRAGIGTTHGGRFGISGGMAPHPPALLPPGQERRVITPRTRGIGATDGRNISEFIGRRKTMVYAYSGNVIFQLATYFTGIAHNAPLFVVFAIISGGLSGANFPMTAALVADY
jgi:hypothetical protein